MVNCKIIYEPTSVVMGYYAFNNYPLTNSIINIQGHGKYLIIRIEHIFKTRELIETNEEYSTNIYVKKYR
jgi:hypothetical protein